jgi:GNAT superfamily N-acetyltransferase
MATFNNHHEDCIVELAIDQDNAETIANIINQAYRVGETGILIDTPGAPLQRATIAEVREMVKRSKLLVLKSSANATIIGCIKVDLLEGGRIGEWGCLAVAADHQGKGYGAILVAAVEFYMKHSHSCSVAQLELLAPSNWKHEHKEHLRRWYQRMGYELQVDGDYSASTITLREGSVLGERFRLATQADFTTYQKKLG